MATPRSRIGAALSIAVAVGFALAAAAGSAATAAPLEDEVGRSEVRVRSGPYPLVAGRTVTECALPRRLERLGYRRVHERPSSPGEFFWGHDVFWIYRRAHRLDGVDHAASLIGLDLRRQDGRILGALSVEGDRFPLEREGLLWLEPETLSESLEADRGVRFPVVLDLLPEHVWRAVLAAEDARFFDHGGVDTRSLARAALENLRAGRITQGGSTITQQLIKNRELTPTRSVGRKLSEAARALLLEAEYPKREILQAYLNQVYLGHVDGLAVHGVGAAARVYFSTEPDRLTLAEAALLAGIIHAPNRLTPLRHPERARERRDRVLGRMEELGWIRSGEAQAARRTAVRLRRASPTPPPAAAFVRWVGTTLGSSLDERLERGRGLVMETTLDPYLQELAEQAVGSHLERLRRQHRRLRDTPLSAALVALDARTGAVLAWIGGDPQRGREGFDRARDALRQPGSAIKPLVLLEAFERCGDGRPLHPATRVLDGPLRIDLPSEDWQPLNFDRDFRGEVDVRAALAESINVPFVRIARRCGFRETAGRLRRAGLEIPAEPPPSFVLGSIEVTPLALARAYTVFATPGYAVGPTPWTRVERPAGRPLLTERPDRQRVVRPATAWLVRDLMREAVESGTASVAAIDGLDVVAKTGTSSELRDAWLAGSVGPLVTVVWVGRDDGSSLGLTGAQAAGPVWSEFMRAAVPARPLWEPRRPSGIVERFVDPRTGLLVRPRNRHASREIFRRGALPRRNRFWRVDRPAPVLR